MRATIALLVFIVVQLSIVMFMIHQLETTMNQPPTGDCILRKEDIL